VHAPTTVVGASPVLRGAGRKGVGAACGRMRARACWRSKRGVWRIVVGHVVREAGFAHAIDRGGGKGCIRDPTQPGRTASVATPRCNAVSQARVSQPESSQNKG
jgi:hypothetical protein